ncbi:MAG: ABC transporter substrate-binding protein [Magnetococcales bacterium]|nr:ABC transporter substrate-binding protein [Magnetococcales bacterium]
MIRPVAGRKLPALILAVTALGLAACGGSPRAYTPTYGSSQAEESKPLSALGPIGHARQMEAQDNRAAAIRYLQDALARTPHADWSGEALVEIGRMFLDDEKLTAAQEVLTRALSMRPPPSSVYPLLDRLAEARMAKGDTASSWKTWLMLVEGGGPEALRAWRNIVTSYVEQGKKRTTGQILSALSSQPFSAVQARTLLDVLTIPNRNRLVRLLGMQPAGSLLSPYLSLAIGDRLAENNQQRKARKAWRTAADLARKGNPSVGAPDVVASEAAHRLQKVAPSASFRIGLLLPLHGKFAPLGENLLQAAQKALLDYRDANMTLVVEDSIDKGDVEGPTRRLLSRNVNVILGPVFHDAAMTASALAAVHGVPILPLNPNQDIIQTAYQTMRGASQVTVSTEEEGGEDPIALTSPHVAAGDAQSVPAPQAPQEKTFSIRSERTDGSPEVRSLVLLNAFHPEHQAQKMARFSVLEARRRHVAIMAPDTKYGRVISQAFGEEMRKLGGHVARTVLFEKGSLDFSKWLKTLVHLDPDSLTRRAKNSRNIKILDPADSPTPARASKLPPWTDFDVLFVPTTAPTARLIAPQASFFNFHAHEITMLGIPLWNRQALLQEGTDYLQGAVFCDLSDQKKLRFQGMFHEVWRKKPTTLAMLTYDGVAVLGQLLRDQRLGGPTWHTAWHRPEGFRGSGGRVRFTEQGRSLRHYKLYTVGKKGFEAYASDSEEAPDGLIPEAPESTPSRSRNFN